MRYCGYWREAKEIFHISYVIFHFSSAELPLPLGEGWGEGLWVRTSSTPLPQPFSQREKGDGKNDEWKMITIKL